MTRRMVGRDLTSDVPLKFHCGHQSFTTRPKSVHPTTCAEKDSSYVGYSISTVNMQCSSHYTPTHLFGVGGFVKSSGV